jgi:hypothetical protein
VILRNHFQEKSQLQLRKKSKMDQNLEKVGFCILRNLNRVFKNKKHKASAQEVTFQEIDQINLLEED